MSTLKGINLQIARRKLPIFIGKKAISELVPFLKKRKSIKVYLIADQRLVLARKNIKSLLIKADFDFHEIAVKAGENLKDIKEIYPIYEKLLNNQADRDSIILALGGGSIGDAAGFIASTYMRGIDWISIPTTLLAQVDSGVGGKTGINHRSGKNLIGTFHQPSLVICDTNFLKTLSQREMISGLGEIIKYAIAFDRSFFNYLNQHITKVLKFNFEVIQFCIERSLYWKCKLVSKDEFDRNKIREKLNFGHTFGHALESATQYQVYQHGEAIILGIKFATALSVQKGYLAQDQGQKIVQLLTKLSVPSIPKKIKANQIFKLMKKDKKNENNRLRFILLERIGKTKPDSNVLWSDLIEVYKKW